MEEQEIISFIYNVLEAKFAGLNDREIEDLVKIANEYINAYPHLAQIAKDKTISQRKAMEMQRKYENSSLCAACGGMCCKNIGCDYLTTDIPSLKEEDILKLLKTNRTSIISDIALVPQEKKYKVTLLLSARNSHRRVIDLVSVGTPCASLGPNGCKLNFKNRPGEGRHLIPGKYFLCNSDLDVDEEINKWRIYQEILKRIVTKYTNRTLEEELSLEMENFFYDVLSENFYNATFESRINATIQVEGLIPYFKDEYQRAEERYLAKNNNLRLINRRKI